MRLLRRFPATLAWVALYLFSLGAAHLADVPLWLAMGAVLGLALPTTLLACWEWSFWRPDRRGLGLIAAFALLWLATALATRRGLDWRLGQPANTVFLLAATFGLGFFIAAEIQRVGHLIPVCLLGALVDVLSVLGGPSRRLGEQTARHVAETTQRLGEGLPPPPPPLSTFLVLKWPQPGADGLATLVGFGDLVFFALLLGAARRFGLPVARSLLLLVAGLALALGASFALRAPVPALPFCCGLFLAGHLRRLSLERREWLLTLGVSLAVVALGLAILLVRR